MISRFLETSPSSNARCIAADDQTHHLLLSQPHPTPRESRYAIDSSSLGFLKNRDGLSWTVEPKVVM